MVLIRGFGFLELLLVLFLVAILALITIPSWQNFIARNRAATLVNNLVAAINFAKTAAVMRGEKVRFCKSNDGEHCGASEVFWCGGQIVITEKGKVLRVLSALPSGDELTWHASLTQQDFLEFVSDGSTNGIQGSFDFWPNKTHNPTKQNAYQISVNFNGRIVVNVVNNL